MIPLVSIVVFANRFSRAALGGTTSNRPDGGSVHALEPGYAA